MYVVVMFEPKHKDENIDLVGQLNEVFGPFPDEESAEKWLNVMLKERMPSNLKSRKWLITPLSNPDQLLFVLSQGSN